jgi:Domain of unknown function (DUF4258)
LEPPFDKILFTQALQEGNIVWRRHVLEKMLERGISRNEVLQVLLNGEVIQRYDEDKPFPSMLVLGFSVDRPLHVVASFDENNQVVFVITTYEPDLNIFEDDFKTKKR